jgi:uncharacterized protein (DUF302 family)
MSYARSLTLDLPYDQAVTRVKQAFAEQGFGTLTEIDVRATLAEKLGVGMEGYLIIGACNPRLAHRALDAERSVGLLLPCNVVVRETREGTRVEALDPAVIAEVPGNPRLRPVADEAGRLIEAALESLRSDAVPEAGEARS